MQDLTPFAEQLVVGYLRTPEGEAKAKESIRRILDSAIDSALGYRSAFREQVDAAVAKALQLHQDIQIESYNDAIVKILERQLQHATKDAIERQVAERMKTLLAPVPAEITLSALVEKYREYLKDRHDGGCVCHGAAAMTFLHQTRDDGFHYYYLDDEPDRPENKCEIRFGVYKGKMFTLGFDSSDAESRLFVGPLYGFHRLLFQLKAANATLVLDCEPADVDLEYASHD